MDKGRSIVHEMRKKYKCCHVDDGTWGIMGEFGIKGPFIIAAISLSERSFGTKRHNHIIREDDLKEELMERYGACKHEAKHYINNAIFWAYLERHGDYIAVFGYSVKKIQKEIQSLEERVKE